MFNRRVLVSLACTVAFLAALPALAAQELREPYARLVVDLPNNWVLTTENNYAVAYPQDKSFHLRMIATTHGMTQAQADEDYALGFLKQHFSNIVVSQHARTLSSVAKGYTGWEIFGTGNEIKSGTPGRFFLALIVDRTNAQKGAIIIGTGTLSGFDKHQPGIHEALSTIRQY